MAARTHTKHTTKPRSPDLKPSDVAARTEQLWVPVKDIKVDPTYQRPIQQARVERMAMHFDPDAFGSLTLSRRETGFLYVVDGQHRVALMRSMGWDDQQVPALVYHGLSLEEEARIFRIMNAEAAKPKALDIWKARLAEGEPVAVDITRIVESLGLKISGGLGNGHIAAVSSLERVYVQGGGPVLLNSLRTMKAAWGHLDGTLQMVYLADMISAIGVLFTRYGRLIDTKRLEVVLSRTTPGALLTDAKVAAKALTARDVSVNVAPMVIVQRYNGRLKSAERLPTWEQRNGSSVWRPHVARAVAG
jgi:hypothetical protein